MLQSFSYRLGLEQLCSSLLRAAFVTSSPAPSVHFPGILPSGLYSLCSSASTDRLPGLNSMTLNVILFLLSPSRHPVFGIFKRSIVHSSRSLIHLLHAYSHCSEGSCDYCTSPVHTNILGGVGAGWGDGRTYNLECVEMWERFAQLPVLVLPSMLLVGSRKTPVLIRLGSYG